MPSGDFGHDRIRHGADQIGRHVDAVHIREKCLNLAHREPARVERDDRVIEAREASLVFADQPRLETAVPVARHGERQRAVIRQHGLAAAPIAMIRGVFGLGPARHITEMVAQLGAQGPLDDRLLEPADSAVELLGRQWPLAHESIENLGGNGRQGRFRHGRFRFRGINTPHVMPHTQNP